MMDLNKLLRDYDDGPRTKEYAAHVRNLRRRGKVICVPRSFFEQPKLISEVDPTYRLQPER